MRRFKLTFAAFACLTLTVLAQAVPRSLAADVDATAAPGNELTKHPLVVHEWGTLTSFSGADGVQLEFRPLINEDLPPFVIDRMWQAGQVSLFAKGRYRALQRMETPVIYFYSDVAQDVNVKVAFPNGLLTEFYPPVKSMTPAYSAKNDNQLQNSSLDWGLVQIIPTIQLRAAVSDPQLQNIVNKRLLRALIPETPADNHYQHAREADAAIVHVQLSAPKSAPAESADGIRMPPPSGSFFEKFLFYRGIGNFSLPLKLRSHGEGSFELHNQGAAPIGSLFLVSVNGNDLSFDQISGLEGRQTMQLRLTGEHRGREELGKAMTKSLVDQGLFLKEAQAMVRTWSQSWFGEQGTRVFYMLPRQVTDEFLPLTIEPQPHQLERVFVARLEIMTPEEELRINSVVSKSYQARNAWNKRSEVAKTAEPYPMPAELSAMARLAEPALVRVKSISTDANLRTEASQLLAELATIAEQNKNSVGGG